MGVETAIIVGAAVVSAYSQYRAGKAEADAARNTAALKQAQSREMREKMAIQANRMLQQGEEFKGKQNLTYAAGGVQVGTGATLVAMEDTNMKITQNIEDMERDVLFKSNQLDKGSEYDIQQGRNAQTSGAILATGTLLGGMASASRYSSSKKEG